MKQTIALLREERRARFFFAALAQSALGTGAGQVALLVVAYARFHSPWAISLVLLADFLPPMLLGPVLGAAADRWSRTSCVVIGDVVRAVAFVGLAVLPTFGATLCLALVAGVGTAFFRPAALAGLTALTGPSRTAAATSLYGAITDLGYTLGPATAALGLIFLTSETLLAINGATFAVSAVVVSQISLGRAPRVESGRSEVRSLLADTREGMRVLRAARAVRVLIATSAAAMFFGGAFNVVELPFATTNLGVGGAGFGALLAVFGTGFVVGSLAGSRGGDPPALKHRYTAGLAVMGVGAIGAGVASSFPVAAIGFAAGGLGNGLFVVHERLLLQQGVPGHLLGRVFGVSDTAAGWALAAAFLSTGAVADTLGPRAVVLIAGASGVVLAGLAALTLRREWTNARTRRALAGVAAAQG